MIEIISQLVPAGTPVNFNINGEYFEVLEAQYPFDVFLLDKHGAQLSVIRNAEASFFVRPGEYHTVQVQSATAQIVRFFVGSGDAGTRRISSSVSVIDASYLEAKAGRVYTATMNQSGVAGQFGHVSLKNTGTDLMEIVEMAGVGGGSQAVYYGAYLGAALTTLLPGAAPRLVGTVAPVLDPGAELRAEANAVQKVISVVDWIYCGLAPDRDLMKRSVLLQPGATLCFVSTAFAANVFVGVTYNRRPL